MTNLFAGLRNTVEHFLVDECTITGATEVEFDDDQGHDVDVPGDEVYEGKCWVRPSSGPREVGAGEGPLSLRMFDVWLPWHTTGIEIDHVVTVTACADPQMIGRALRVLDVQGGSSGPHRKLLCEDTLTVTLEEGGS